MTTPCTCKAEHWQPHADSCPQAKQRAPKIGVNSEDIVDLLRKVPRATALPPDEEGWRLMIGGICHKAADELTQLRGNLSLAEEGLANYALEVEGLRSDFKNFHRLLCERFDYGHDEADWERDQLSLIEWIAKRAAHEPLHVGSPVTFTPRYASTLPRDGWTIDQLPPEPTFIIRAPTGCTIAVSASEIQPEPSSAPSAAGHFSPEASDRLPAEASGPATVGAVHTTEEDFQHFMAYSNLKESHALRWAFYAGKGEPPPGKAELRPPARLEDFGPVVDEVAPVSEAAWRSLSVSAEEAKKPLAFRHWSKDFLVPYMDCHCSTCVAARAEKRT